MQNESLNDQMMINALADKDKAKELVRLFYNHTISLSSMSDSMQLEILTESQVCDILLRILMDTDMKDIINIVSEGFVPFEVKVTDVCQFSSLADCYYKSIDLIIRSGIKGVSWEKLGFMLRVKPRSVIADIKYGENQGKTATQMGLCYMDKHKLFWATSFGMQFNQLGQKDKEALLPKLCFYIPIVQNCICSEDETTMLATYLELLSLKTQKRRKPNIKRLLNIVKESVK